MIAALCQEIVAHANAILVASPDRATKAQRPKMPEAARANEHRKSALLNVRLGAKK